MTNSTRGRPSADSASIVRGAAAGLVAGLIASFAMDRFQAAIAALSPPDSAAEPATDRTADRLSNVLTGHELAPSDKPLGGQLVHYALGGVLGTLYGIAAEYRPEVRIGHGTAFGVGVAAVLDDAVVPAVGLGDPPWRTGLGTHLYALASHIVFGAVTELARAQIRSGLGVSRAKGNSADSQQGAIEIDQRSGRPAVE